MTVQEWYQSWLDRQGEPDDCAFVVDVQGLAEEAWETALVAERERCAKILEAAMEEVGGDATERTLAGEAAADSTGWLRFAQSEMAMGFYKTLRLLVEKIRQG